MHSYSVSPAKDLKTCQKQLKADIAMYRGSDGMAKWLKFGWVRKWFGKRKSQRQIANDGDPADPATRKQSFINLGSCLQTVNMKLGMDKGVEICGNWPFGHKSYRTEHFQMTTNNMKTEGMIQQE